MAQIISAIQSKGGAGKSAMLCCLAGLLVGEGSNVLIIDTDPQATSTTWAEKTDKPNLDVMELLKEDSLFDVIEAVSEKYDYIMIDTAGFDSRMASYAMQAAQLVLIPTNGSLNDVLGATKTWKHVESITSTNKRPPVTLIAFWAVKTNTSVFEHAKSALTDAKAPLLLGAVKDLTGFDKMTWNGGMPDGAAMQSVLGFYRRLKQGGHLESHRSEKAA